ncbi:MAG: carboxymuconolactone decarboxylase family protein [Clostridiales bacterium]|jgi:AhpD family alkylhydroperoxidase|nr:carboxymuconolactone decarboxylase family protein [Clostridiales bacterium]
MPDYKKSLQNVNKNMMELARALPDEMKGFMSLHDAALKEGAIDPKTKELIALGISICIRCEPCIVSHVDSLVKMGVTKEEVQETVAVAVFMGGGPSVAYGGKALEVFDQLS